MRLLRTVFRASVHIAAPGAPRPVLIGFGPKLTFEASISEARQLALDLADAVEAAELGGASG